ncbi:hypothetical protein DEJ13_16895 [Curtobacterium sp. MCLR17_007]|uniref:hypothetical protein n=1 Tax=unclassified Curtobacterium TaxID=257496 RepID=UPI000701CAEA|nr:MULTISPECIES: hypothetical protein [unclassified Curtobacterium]KQS10019.1 hypothetical protein ASG04_05400 [Curtobacterium sp. Leaf183]WIB60092.1 hypothetical protein DEJ13_16895 [Curtobacterium sp. MCLR17_007]
MSMSSAFDPSKGLAIPEDKATENGLELDQDPAHGLDIAVEVVSGAAADPAAPALFLEPQTPSAVRVPSPPTSA